MKNNFFFKFLVGNKLVVLYILLTCLFFNYCKEEPQIWKLKSEEQVVGDYIFNNPEKFSEFTKLVESAGLTSLLKIRGPFTLFLPTNEAMLEYYKQKNVNSINDIDDTTFLYQLAANHIIPTEIRTGDIGLGAVREPNGLGDYLSTEFNGSDIVINKSAKIIKRDIRAANGYIHVIDKVLEPVTTDIYSLVSSNPSFKIFSEGLKLTGINDTLKLISFPYGSKVARTRFTILAVPDTTYQQNGINNVEDLIKWCGANSDSLTSMDNSFYRYMEYHCLIGSYYLSDLNTGIYPILSHDNNIGVTIDNDYKLNLDAETQKYTGFNIPESNYSAKNGTLHTINSLLPVALPTPAKITFEVTDYFDLKQGDYYKKYYMKWSDGQNSFEKIKFQGDYLLYYYKINHGRTAILNYDCLSMLGYWWIEITTPKIMKGRYSAGANIWTGGDDLAIFDVYIDGKSAAKNINARLSTTKMDFGVVNWTKTEEHKIKLVCVSWGMLFWDTVIFTPVK